MALAIPEIRIGALIEEIHDDRGRPLPVRRRGYIVRVEYPGGEVYSASGVERMWVQFEQAKEPEEVRPCRCAIVRGFDASAAGRIKQAEANRLGEGLVRDERAVTMDRTGVESKKPLSEHDIEEHLAPAPARGRKSS